ncbi:glycosyltransferase family 9 protein [Emticicia sp. 21SJ11W-3]|uniref:glycosyltransferase family 9 protein n=1 Tax=Emticicia sp. 21SJ11W-3 TaxID=2916755 RepID=UPI0020A09AF9|nr:glycosyltransferase family 9 protein [Emticicia sp. 21SJ11W-3]UTA66145.1 glycosyltransferase family 9 protein [Emticicia sp. 21SJ11W-3]
MKTKFLILRFSSIGDIILTTPVVRCLKLQYPNAEVHFATKKQFKVLVENNPYIDKYFLLDGPLNNFVETLKAENYHYVIDLHNNLRTSVIKFRLGKPSFGYNKLNFEKWLLVNLKINRMPNVHIVDRNLKTVESLGVINDNKGLDYFIPEQHKVNLSQVIGDTPSFVAYAIGGQHFTKKLPTEKIIELCSKIDKKIVLLGGKEDEPNGDIIANAMGNKVYNACGKYNLNQSASILQQAEYVISHDTGLMHIASALKKRIVSIWGNTVPEFGMYPYQTQFSIIENKGLPCRPCSKIGYSKCPKGHFKCMNNLEINKIEF